MYKDSKGLEDDRMKILQGWHVRGLTIMMGNLVSTSLTSLTRAPSTRSAPESEPDHTKVRCTSTMFPKKFKMRWGGVKQRAPFLLAF